MGKVTGFLEIEREDRDYQPVAERIKHWHEFVLPLPEKEIREQAARCMDCGVPYCHGTSRITGAPPAARSTTRSRTGTTWSIAATGKRPRAICTRPTISRKFTGRVCPAPCEASCTLNIDDEPGHHQDDRMRDRRPRHRARASSPRRRNARPARRSRSSAPARRASPARSSSRAPATRCMSTRRWAKAGGLLRYGIPDFKMEKVHVDRRVEQMQGEGVPSITTPMSASTSPADKLVKDHDAVRARRRRRKAARPADPGPRAQGHPFRHGLPAAAEPPHQQRAARATSSRSSPPARRSS